MKNAILGFVLIFACVNYVGLASIREMKETPRLKISIGAQVFYANIQANESATALLKQLPFTLIYGGIERQ